MTTQQNTPLDTARRAHGELAASLSMLSDKLAEAQLAMTAGDYGRAKRAIAKAQKEIDAAHGYLAAARDEHRDIARRIASTERPVQ